MNEPEATSPQARRCQYYLPIVLTAQRSLTILETRSYLLTMDQSIVYQLCSIFQD